MHFLKKTTGFLAVFCVIPGAIALTGRTGIVTTAASRVPSVSKTIASSVSSTTSSSSSSTTTSSTLLQNAECIEAYTSCMKSGDACGPNFEECTNKVLFHAKMPQCLGTLAQCASAGVSSLFGTATVSALANVASTNSYGEVTNYTYPTDGSVLGQLITGAAISNRYDTSTCVRRYTSCLKKDSVCGNDFELCTTNTEFKKQRVFCDSTLARCQSEGLIELLGSASTTATPTASSRIGEMISEGAALAAVNAVSTCYKVIDQCILGACAANPYKCYESATDSSVKLVDAINNGGDISSVSDGGISTLLPTAAIKVAEVNSSSSIAGYIRNVCESTIGGNKYCYATFIGNGMMPTSSQLSDEDNQAEIYDQAYSSRMNAAMKANITELVNQFDTKAKNKCLDTIKSCAMRVCGGGSGAACYTEVFGSGTKSINKSGTWEDIKTGCESVVNTDLYCKYAAENPNAVGTYNYTFNRANAFETLFPPYEDGGNDPIGVVASLNASLATAYNDAAIAQMKKQCQSIATSCVKSLCGNDYQSCYRNRTDVYSDLTYTGNDKYDQSMNKVGGVLDYTIVIGLCLDTVKNASVCEEHLNIEANKIKRSSDATSAWGDATSVRGGWMDAGRGTTAITEKTEEVDALDENGNQLCTSKSGEEGVCYTVDAAGNVFDTPVKISYTTFVQSQAASSLFKDLIYDLEKEAQAKYNAALTREQRQCLSQNNGGIMGTTDSGSTYMWVKLKSNKIPAAYAVEGLKTNQFVASNDLYGSFCRVRVTLQSDDKKIQGVISKGASWSTAYFATGDMFTCGSWIPESALVDIANAVANDATKDMEKNQKRVRTWTTIVGALGSAGGGALLGEGLRKGNILGGLTGLGTNVKKDKNSNDLSDEQLCSQIAKNMKLFITDEKADSKDVKAVKDNISKLVKAANKVGATTASTKAKSVLDKWVNEQNGLDPNDIIPNTAKAAKDGLDVVAQACDEAAGKEAKSGNSKNGWIVTAASTAVAGTAGAILVNKATRDIQQSQLDAAQKAAYEEWMNDVGNHISCFVGEEEIPYGGVATINLD